MKKFLLMVTMSLLLVVSSSFSQEEAVKKKLPTAPVETQKKTLPSDVSKPIGVEKTQKAKANAFKADVSGRVISLAKLAMGFDATLTKTEAEDLVKKGQPLALKQGDEIYLVYNSKNMFDGKSLAKYAEVTNLGISGEIKYLNGFPVIIAKKMQAID